MRIGCPKELIIGEHRVALTPTGVHSLVMDGHEVYLETEAGSDCGLTNDQYLEAGAQICETAAEVWERTDLICKVKEPLAQEFPLMREGQTVFTYLHLAAKEALTHALLDQKVTGIAYETVMLPDRSLPLLAPMSEVAGRMAVQVGATLLQSHHGGSGTLLAGVPGVLPAEVLIIGAGVVGQNAARIAMGIGAHVTITDLNVKRLKEVDEWSAGRIATLISTPFDIAKQVAKTDLLIGAVLIPGAKAPRVVTEEMVASMRPGSAIVDVAIDQGGCIETMDRITTHENPYFIKHGVVHYSVANIPGAVARTSTFALTGVTLPYVQKLAKLGTEAALQADPALLLGLNTYKGQVTVEGVADAYGLTYVPPETALAKA